MKVILSPGITATIACEAAASSDGLETGGILLGHDLGDELLITVAGGPGPDASRQPSTFLRDLRYAQELGDEAYDIDGSVWIGDWHTHPGGLAAPSAKDLATYSSLLGDTGLAFDRFLALIVTPCAVHGWAETLIHAWLIDARGARTVRLSNADDESLRPRHASEAAVTDESTELLQGRKP